MRIMFVTDSPFLPKKWGDAARIARLVELFVDYGWTVDFTYFDESERESDTGAMLQFCERVEAYKGTPTELAQRQGGHLDDWCVPGFAKFVERMVAIRRPDVIWVQFVYHSRVLSGLGGVDRPISVIDADNVFADRRNAFDAAHIDFDWFSTSKMEELNGLRRADVIVAIQEAEAKYYKELDSNLEVNVVPYAPPVKFLPSVNSKSLAFVATNNPQNRDGIEMFLRDAWPTIRTLHPDATLKVVGSIAEVVDEGLGIKRLVFVESLAEIFNDVAIGLNTTLVGSGLKTKSVDILAHGRPLVSTREGVRGLEFFSAGFRIAEDGQAFANVINKLFSEPNLINKLTGCVQSIVESKFSVSATFEPIEKRLRHLVKIKRGSLC